MSFDPIYYHCLPPFPVYFKTVTAVVKISQQVALPGQVLLKWFKFYYISLGSATWKEICPLNILIIGILMKLF